MESDYSFISNNISFSLFSATTRDVNYSCGSCGYRNTYAIDSKSIKKGTFSFFSIDETRFTHTQVLKCIPYYTSIRSWGLFQTITKLLCYNCGKHIGNANNNLQLSNSKLHSISWDGICNHTTYEIKIRALQPSNEDEDFTSTSIVTV